MALALIVIWLVVVAVLRGYLHARRTGAIATTVRDRRGTAQWWARVLATIGLALAVAAPIAELLGMPAIGLLDHVPLRVAGIVIATLGIGATFAAQEAMGASWRPDVDPEARTELATTGPYRVVRNPVLAATGITIIGIAMIVPNVLALAMVTFVLASHQVLVRLVEEPYLRRVHGAAYASYAARTGRFIPWLGRDRRR